MSLEASLHSLTATVVVRYSGGTELMDGMISTVWQFGTFDACCGKTCVCIFCEALFWMFGLKNSNTVLTES